MAKPKKITIDQESTIIVNSDGENKNIATRIHQVKAQVEHVSSDYDKEKLLKRLAKLSGGVAILSIGAATELEMKEKKDRVDDALNATRAAMEEGIVPGGGVAFVRSISAIENLKGENEDQNTGIAIIKRVLEQPLRQIVENAGKEGAVILGKVKEGKLDYGYNAQNEQFENLYHSGVIDPAKVTRIALEKAASIAGFLLITECVIFDKPLSQEAEE